MVARDYVDFAVAMTRKLLREIDAAPLAGRQAPHQARLAELPEPCCSDSNISRLMGGRKIHHQGTKTQRNHQSVFPCALRAPKPSSCP
jgi:hypothetical protein